MTDTSSESAPRDSPGRGSSHAHEKRDGHVSEWEEYRLLVDLFKFYLDLGVKGMATYFAIVGAIITVVLSNVNGDTAIVYALLVPIFLSVLVAVASLRLKPKVRQLDEAVRELSKRLELSLGVHVELLVWVNNAFVPLVLSVAVVLIGVFTYLIVR